MSVVQKPKNHRIRQQIDDCFPYRRRDFGRTFSFFYENLIFVFFVRISKKNIESETEFWKNGGMSVVQRPKKERIRQQINDRFPYCMWAQNESFSKQNLQGATAASFCRILDREEALESSNAEL